MKLATMRRILIVAVAVLALIVPTLPASAHEPSLRSPDNRGTGQILNGHTDAVACDNVSDLFSIQTQYILNGGFEAVTDLNGSLAGCGIDETSGTISEFRVCEIPTSGGLICTGWATA